MTDKSMEVLDTKTGELVHEIPPTPEDLLVAASQASKALERVIELNERPPVMFNGKRYLEFHHWQTVAKFYHCTARTFEAVPCEIDGIKGFHAKAEVIDEKTGLIVGGAEAYCFRDEANWSKKPLFQLASMAQTRAASKALANKFRFVAIVAGYEGTPSEEMTDGTIQRQVAMPRTKEVPQAEGHNAIGSRLDNVGAVATIPDSTGAIDGQVSEERKPKSKLTAKLYALVREKKIDDSRMKQIIAQMFSKHSSKDLVDAEVVALIRMVEGGAFK